MTDIHAIFASSLDDDCILNPNQFEHRDTGYCKDNYKASLLLRPASTDDVSNICRLANDAGIALVPQGGLTGLVDGTSTKLGQVALSTERMKRIVHIDPMQMTVVAEAGVILQDLDLALSEYDLAVGVDIPSRGSCTLGGLVATNAGGVRVLRYGMMRDNLLGLEAVLADGQVIDDMNPLLKNNAGYDLKQLFIGSEGTLGVVTKVILKLWPRPKAFSTALVACANSSDLLTLFSQARITLGSALLSFEAMWPEYYKLTTSAPGLGKPPLETGYGIYGLIEVTGDSENDAEQCQLGLLEKAFQRDLVEDGVIAKSDSERSVFWRIREDSDLIVEGFHAMLSYDVGIKLQDMGNFVSEIKTKLHDLFPGLEWYFFGHLGDSNLHVCAGVSENQMINRRDIDVIFYGIVASYNGNTISAEHCIGLKKREFLSLTKPQSSMDLMLSLKRALDPNNILNPDKIFIPKALHRNDV